MFDGLSKLTNKWYAQLVLTAGLLYTAANIYAKDLPVKGNFSSGSDLLVDSSEASEVCSFSSCSAEFFSELLWTIDSPQAVIANKRKIAEILVNCMDKPL